jgi:hypothetical protein
VCALFVAAGSVPSRVLAGGASGADPLRASAVGDRDRREPVVHFYARSCINYSYLSLCAAALQIVPVINPESAVFYERERIKQRPTASVGAYRSSFSANELKYFHDAF